jgi:4-cresol dehydrogenase (hydroxylating)
VSKAGREGGFDGRTPETDRSHSGPPLRAGRLKEATRRWRERLGSEHVDEQAAATERYGPCTTGIERRILAALRPGSREDVPAILAVARECGVPLYPISTGHNWGYGTALPATHDCAVLDLSRLKAIRVIDPELGLFELEPGVTQGALAAWLEERGLRFMVPTTGAGPEASLLGNALERGYGITPIADHFSAVTRIEAVLPDGSLYVPALTAFGTELADQVFKYGPGPYLDGIFTQSNMGIVTAVTLALARRPERIEAFYFAVPNAAAFQEAAAGVRSILQELGSVCGSVNLMNRHRVLAMTAPYDRSQVGEDGLLREEALERLGRRFGVDDWLGMGALYGPTAVVKAARALVRKRLAGSTRRLVFMTASRARLLHRVGAGVLGMQHGIPSMIGRMREALEILEGRPNRVAHPLVYWKSGTPVDTGSRIDPARDRRGLLWYAPLIPFQPELMERYAERCAMVLRAHRMEPLITLSTLSPLCLDSSVPLLFDVDKPEEVERAHRCYDALLEMGRELGVAPYRLHIGAMDRFVEREDTFWKLVRTLKQAIDPQDILSPGRYASSSGRRGIALDPGESGRTPIRASGHEGGAGQDPDARGSSHSARGVAPP